MHGQKGETVLQLMSKRADHRAVQAIQHRYRERERKKRGRPFREGCRPPSPPPDDPGLHCHSFP